MSDVNDGGPAFPFGQMSEQTGQPINGCFSSGMTLRDYLAAHAMCGLQSLRDERTWSSASGKPLDEWRREVLLDDAKVAYMAADAMLKAREAK